MEQLVFNTWHRSQRQPVKQCIVRRSHGPIFSSARNFSYQVIWTDMYARKLLPRLDTIQMAHDVGCLPPKIRRRPNCNFPQFLRGSIHTCTVVVYVRIENNEDHVCALFILAQSITGTLEVFPSGDSAQAELSAATRLNVFTTSFDRHLMPTLK